MLRAAGRNVNAACCVPASACTNGVPAQCNSQCAHVFLLFYNRCFADLSALIHEQLGVFDELAQKCQVVKPQHSCLSELHQQQANQYLDCLSTGATPEERSTCAERVRGLLGLQGMQAIRGPEFCRDLELVLPLLADSNDDSSHDRDATTHGDAYIADGGHFDGSGDYISVPSFDYATDGQFSVGIWFTKESCTGGIYEYLFSHASHSVNAVEPFSTPNSRLNPPNPNVHTYIGCEGSGGGWSELGGTIVRYNIYDDQGTAAMFDYPAWTAASFDEVTNVWIHSLMAVDQSVIKIFIDGEQVDDSAFGFYTGGRPSSGIPLICRGNAACDQRTGHATLSSLNTPIGTASLATDIFLGGRMDLNADRHFKGKLAGLTVSSDAMSDTEVECVFNANEGLLPALPTCNAMVAEMMMGGNFELDITFLGGVIGTGARDVSGKNHQITDYGGDVTVTDAGATFDGDGDYLTIEDFNYEDDGDFTISMWITKDDCKSPTETFEYLYSHVQNTEGQHVQIDDPLNSNINVYVGCEKPGGADVGSTVDGTVLRFNLIDKQRSWVLMDYPLQISPQQDGITATWVSVILTVTRHMVNVYIDGEKIDDATFGFPTDSMGSCMDLHIQPTCNSLVSPDGGCDRCTGTHACTEDMQAVMPKLDDGSPDPQYARHTLDDFCDQSCGGCSDSSDPRAGITNNIAYPRPSHLRRTLDDFDLRSDIYVGARYDLDPSKHFKGKLSLLKVYSSPLNDAESRCLFSSGDIL